MNKLWSDTTAAPVAGVSTRLVPRVGVIVAAPDALTAAEHRLVSHLTTDPRFAFAGLVRRRASARPSFPLVRFWLGLERGLVPTPARNPLPKLDLVALPLADDGADPPDIVVDLYALPRLAEAVGRRVWGFEVPIQTAVSASFGGAPVTEVTLCASGAQPEILDRAVFDAKTLASHNAAYALEKAVLMVVAALARLAATGDARRLDAPLSATASSGRPRGHWAYPKHVIMDATWRLREKLADRRSRTIRPFTLRIGEGTYHDFDPKSLRDIAMPEDAYWADPFLIERDGSLYCFFEDLPPDRGIAHISVGRVEGDRLVDVQDALRLPVHMSYPFVFHHKGDVLMMPEVHEAGRLEIWRAKRFPDEWELYATAFEGTPVADSTLLQDGDNWWLFTHISHDSFGDFCNELHLFHCSGPDLKDLRPHALNPIVVGADRARGGGRIQRVGDRLIRPSQDNSGGSYGWGLNFMEITALSQNDYQERRFRHITPAFDHRLMGCHHADAAAGRVILDVRWR